MTSIAIWNRAYRCYVCMETYARKVPATIRVFCGVGAYAYSGGGWPACEQHANIAIRAALISLWGRHTAPESEVTAYAVVADGPADLRLSDHPLWVARRRIAIICTTCNDTHVMSLRGDNVMCTRCPAPCADCRGRDGIGAYCSQTPCGCVCHTRAEYSPYRGIFRPGGGA